MGLFTAEEGICDLNRVEFFPDSIVAYPPRKWVDPLTIVVDAWVVELFPRAAIIERQIVSCGLL
jgi:hypothetical protein